MTDYQDFKTIGLTPFSIHSEQAYRYAWASHYLQEMSKAVIDDVVKVLSLPLVSAQKQDR